MKEEEKKAIEKALWQLAAVLIRKDDIDQYGVILNFIAKQQKEIEILKNLLIEIREITKHKIITKEDKFYHPAKNLTKQEVYRDFNAIKTLIKGEYCFLESEKAIDSIIEEKLNEN